jgi:hypothetical protein
LERSKESLLENTRSQIKHFRMPSASAMKTLPTFSSVDESIPLAIVIALLQPAARVRPQGSEL